MICKIQLARMRSLMAAHANAGKLLLLFMCLVVLSWTAGAADAGKAALQINEGVVVKFAQDAGIVVRGKLQVRPNVKMTSQNDDTVGGAVDAHNPSEPVAGDWAGVHVSPQSEPADVELSNLHLRYAGGASDQDAAGAGAALLIEGNGHNFTDLTLENNLVGVRAWGPGSSTWSGIRLLNNAVGMEVGANAKVQMSNSEIAGNSEFGIRNLTTANPVQAQSNWWGHVSGPRASDNPDGQGDAVSAGVDFGNFTGQQPVLACSAMPVLGYASRVRNIEIALHCATATHFRIGEQSDLSAQAWQALPVGNVSVSYVLSEGAGEKQLYVELRNAANSTVLLTLPMPISYVPTGPLVQFVQPASGAVLESDTLIEVSASEEGGVRSVEILVNNQRLALLSGPPYQVLWPVSSFTNGIYSLQAKVMGQSGLTFSVTRQVRIQKTSTGIGPVLNVNWAGAPLKSNTSIANAGTLSVTAESTLGVKRIQLALDEGVIVNRTFSNLASASVSQLLDFKNTSNGSHRIQIQAWDSTGTQSQMDVPVVLALQPPSAPQITSPASGAQVTSPQLSVSGDAAAGTAVTVMVNGEQYGAAVTANNQGRFSSVVKLPSQGSYRLEAVASNARGSSPPSAAVQIQFTAPAPKLAFVMPSANAKLSGTVHVEVNASDAAGIAQVQLWDGTQMVGSLSTAPWSWQWDTSLLLPGVHVLRAVAINHSGQSAEAQQTVQVEAVQAPAPEVVPPYVARAITVSPALSFGDTPVRIQAEVVTSDGAQPVPHASLQMVLNVEGFQRQISLVGDAQGKVDYTFVPASTDAGRYEVHLLHPNTSVSKLTTAQAVFTINRLSASYSQFQLNAIRGVASAATMPVRASVGSGATGVHWRAVPADQPSGSLPAGIQLDLGSPVDIAAGASMPLTVRITGSAEAGAAGTIVLKLFAAESGEVPRAALQLNYQLHDALPGLVPMPAALELGVKQDDEVSGNITLTNKGYSAARNVRMVLAARGGASLPSWVRLNSAGEVGDVNVGQSLMVQISARPTQAVNDGYYQMELRVSADNDKGGSVPVTIAVSRTGEGSANFKIVDIYTNTLDAQGKAIEGVSGTRLTLQNEALTGDIRRVTTNEAGEAAFTNIPPGNYRWRASASNHMDASGRITVYAGITSSERVFLDYQLVNVEFNVTETTIRDEYDIVLEATFQTQVPAPVVLIEPMSVKLPALQQGETFTGELVLSNYGLVTAENVQLILPQSDRSYLYEFFGEVPKQLAAKSRVIIPYRISARSNTASGVTVQMHATNKMLQLGMAYQPSVQIQNALQQFLRTGDAKTLGRSSNDLQLQALSQAASCSGYASSGCVRYDYQCAAGDQRSGSFCMGYHRVSGNSCSVSSGVGWGSSGGGTGGWGGGAAGGAGNETVPLASHCTPGVNDCPPGMKLKSTGNRKF